MKYDTILERINTIVKKIPARFNCYSIHNMVLAELYLLGLSFDLLPLTDYKIEMQQVTERSMYQSKKGNIYIDLVWVDNDGNLVHLIQIERKPLTPQSKKTQAYLRGLIIPTTYIYYSRNKKQLNYKFSGEQFNADKEV